MLYFYRISINDFYIIKQLTLSYKISKFLQKFCLVFCYCLLPDESILIGTGFNFCTINKNGFSGNFSHIKQCIRHFCKDTFRTGSISDQDRRYILFIPEAGEDVELFVNGTSQGIQILPPFLYDITEAVQDGENDIRIEVATTLERERGVNKGKQAPIGIYSTVKIYQI